ncbi:MAG: HAMP domain-containing histidine kinase [Tannerellaceae bacterium]|jgi:signal transduction histidine kinase|nr:HAMP domain-containing histidine kinase [Tannerellaceae bacterium]
MKSDYKQHLFVNLLLLISVFSAGILLLGETQERRYRTRLLTERLDTYAELVHAVLPEKIPSSLFSSSFFTLLPDDLRLTLISYTGTVLYDNYLSPVEINLTGDHSQRPEIKEAFRNGTGINKRMSVSTHQEYLYYAKRYDNCFVRVALPYNTSVRNFFAANSDQMFLYCILGIFTVMLFIIRYITDRFGHLIKKENISAVRQGRFYERTKSKKNAYLLKQEMTENVAHELRTPMSSIRGYLETLLYEIVLPNAVRHFVSKAYRQTLILSELIQDMNTLTNRGDSQKSFHNTYVNLSTLLSSLTADLEDNLNDQGIEIECVNLEEVTISGKNHLVYSIFRNLIDNVVQHAGFGTHIFISKQNEDEHFYTILFADNGVGIMQEEHLKRLFERFYRADEGRIRDTGGSGLGLSIVKNTLQLLGGNIVVCNRVGGGLQFVLRLPRYKLK